MKKQYANSNSYEIKLAAPAAPPVHHKRRNGFKVEHRFTSDLVLNSPKLASQNNDQTTENSDKCVQSS